MTNLALHGVRLVPLHSTYACTVPVTTYRVRGFSLVAVADTLRGMRLLLQGVVTERLPMLNTRRDFCPDGFCT
jgi:hypothetical protein